MLVAAAVVIFLYILYLLRKPLSWIIIAAFIAIAAAGPVNVLQRKMKRGLAITLVYIGLVLIPVALGALLIPRSSARSASWPTTRPSTSRTSRSTSTRTRRSTT